MVFQIGIRGILTLDHYLFNFLADLITVLMSRIPVQGFALCVVPVHYLEQKHFSRFLVFVAQNEKKLKAK